MNENRTIFIKGRPGAVVRAISLSQLVAGLKQPLRIFCGGKALSRFIPSPDPTHVGVSGTASAPLEIGLDMICYDLAFLRWP